MTDELDRQRTGAADILLAALGFAAALVVRVMSWPAVFTDSGIRLVGPDAHYHLRRIQWSVENLPDFLPRDAYVNFPHGGEPIWPALFDAAIALAARAAGQAGDPIGVETVAVWAPPLLGAATVAALYLIARQAFGRRVAVIAAAWLCVLPAHVHYSQVGFVDHHAAVALATSALLAALFATIRRDWDLASAVGLGCVIGLSLLLWPGTLLHIGIAQTVLLVCVASCPREADAARRASHAAVAHGVAFLWVAPFAMGRSWTIWGDLSPLVLSNFQPLWLGLPALGFGACAIAWRLSLAGRSPAVRRTLVAAALGAPAGLALVFPEVRAGVADATAWFFRSEEFQAVVAESLPLFSDGRAFTAERAHRALTPLVYGLPVMLLVIAATRRLAAEHRTLALWSGVLLAATLAQYRFANSFAVAASLTLACTVDLGWRYVRQRSAAARLAFSLGALAVGVLVLAPIAQDLLRQGARWLRAAEGDTVRAPEMVRNHESLVAAAAWLGAHSPETSGWSSPGEEPEYGVLTAWGDGHVVRYVARRPVIQDNFGDDVGRENFADAERYFAAPDEAAALAIADRLRIRYVLVRQAGSGHAPRPYASRSMRVRLHQLRGSAGSLETGDHPDAPTFAPALSRHRLVYESPPRGADAGRFKLFEIVKGGEVVGDASPGALVEARLELESDSPQTESLRYRTHTRASADGRYRLRLPYPTTPFEGRFGASQPYAIESDGVVAPFRLDEASVVAGHQTEGPALVR